MLAAAVVLLLAGSAMIAQPTIATRPNGWASVMPNTILVAALGWCDDVHPVSSELSRRADTGEVPEDLWSWQRDLAVWSVRFALRDDPHAPRSIKALQVLADLGDAAQPAVPDVIDCIAATQFIEPAAIEVLNHAEAIPAGAVPIIMSVLDQPNGLGFREGDTARVLDLLERVGPSDATVIPFLIRQMSSRRQYMFEPAGVARVLGSYGAAAREAVPSLVALSSDPSRSHRVAAYDALLAIAATDERTVNVLRRRLTEPNVTERDHVAAHVGARPVVCTIIRTQLAAMLRSADADEQFVAARAALALGRDAATLAADLAALDASDDPTVRLVAAAALHAVNTGEAPRAFTDQVLGVADPDSMSFTLLETESWTGVTIGVPGTQTVRRFRSANDRFACEQMANGTVTCIDRATDRVLWTQDRLDDDGREAVVVTDDGWCFWSLAGQMLLPVSGQRMTSPALPRGYRLRERGAALTWSDASLYAVRNDGRSYIVAARADGARSVYDLAHGAWHTDLAPALDAQCRAIEQKHVAELMRAPTERPAVDLDLLVLRAAQRPDPSWRDGFATLMADAPETFWATKSVQWQGGQRVDVLGAYIVGGWDSVRRRLAAVGLQRLGENVSFRQVRRLRVTDPNTQRQVFDRYLPMDDRRAAVGALEIGQSIVEVLDAAGLPDEFRGRMRYHIEDREPMTFELWFEHGLLVRVERHPPLWRAPMPEPGARDDAFDTILGEPAPDDAS